MDTRGTDHPSLDEVRGAYDSWATTYIDAFGSAEKASAEDRSTIADWARTVDGPVLDAGCGPGHWSAFLHSLGLQVEGVDATPAFVAHARRAHPDIEFRVDDLRSIDLAPGSLGGVLAWFSLIHLDPAEVPAVLQRFTTALRPGGTLLLGFFSDSTRKAFDHRVVTAWAWPVEQMVDACAQAGLETVVRRERPQPSGRIFADLSAHRPG